MRWALFRHRSAPPPSDESLAAAAEAERALRDAKAMTGAAEELACRAVEVGKSLRETRDRNHVAMALIQAIRGV